MQLGIDMGRLYDEMTKLNSLYPQKILPPLLVDVPDLRLAYKELDKLVLVDGDLGSDYWNRVIKLVKWAEEGLVSDHWFVEKRL